MNECCGDEFHSCRCIQPHGHTGDHECECEGRWSPDGVATCLPRFVMGKGGPFPKGTDLDTLSDEDLLAAL